MDSISDPLGVRFCGPLRPLAAASGDQSPDSTTFSPIVNHPI